MLIGNKFIYFELQKTASSQIRRVFSKINSLKYTINGIHNSYDEVPQPKLGDFNNKIKIGSIRNPWAWYVSLWAWGCKKEGNYKNLVQTPRNLDGLRFFLTNPFTYLKQRKEWRDLYSDANNKENFRRWLEKILIEKKYAVGDGYTFNKINKTCGYLTYHYLKLHALDFKKKSNYLTSINKIRDFDEEYNFIDVIIRTEKFNDDMKKALEKLGLSEHEIAETLLLSKGKANTSKHVNYQYYYDEAAIELVAEREKFIIDKYRYEY